MPKIWLTYAWKDNDDQDVDHVIAELEAGGLEVAYDRVQLTAGQPLWKQIDAAMNDASVDGWAMFVSANSLRSEPCQEEIAYALDRALRSGRSKFPLIGIFTEPLDRSLIPSALATRLYVNLRDPEWVKRVADGVSGSNTIAAPAPPTPFGLQWHDFGGKPVLEVWPRSGRWFPFVVVVPAGEEHLLGPVLFGPRGGITGAGMVSGGEAGSPDGKFKGKGISNAIDALNTAHIFLNAKPSEIHFGEPDRATFKIIP